MRQLLYLLHHSIRPGTGAVPARPHCRGADSGPGGRGLPGDRGDGHRDLLLGPGPEERRDPDRPTGGCLHRRTGCPHPAGEPGAPDHHRGVLPPGGRPAEPLPPVPLVYAVRMRRHPEANEPEIRYHSICAVRCTFKSIF